MRIRTVSVRPPKKPEIMPYVIPTVEPMAAANQADHDRDATAQDDPAQNIAAQLVRSQPVRAELRSVTRRLEACAQVVLELGQRERCLGPMIAIRSTTSDDGNPHHADRAAPEGTQHVAEREHPVSCDRVWREETKSVTLCASLVHRNSPPKGRHDDQS